MSLVKACRGLCAVVPFLAVPLSRGCETYRMLLQKPALLGVCFFVWIPPSRLLSPDGPFLLAWL